MQTDQKEWHILTPIVQSVHNNSTSPHNGNVCSLSAFIGRDPTTPVDKSFRFITITDAQLQSKLNSRELFWLCADLRPHVQSTLAERRKQLTKAASKSQLPKFDDGDYVFVALSDCQAGEKLCPCWRKSRLVCKALNDFIYQVKDSPNGQLNEIRASRLNRFRDSKMDEAAIMSHVLQSEMGMVVSRQLSLEDCTDNLYVLVRWKGPSKNEKSLESIARIFKDIQLLSEKLLQRKSTQIDPVARARAERAL